MTELEAVNSDIRSKKGILLRFEDESREEEEVLKHVVLIYFCKKTVI